MPVLLGFLHICLGHIGVSDKVEHDRKVTNALFSWPATHQRASNRPHRVARRKQVLDENTLRAIRREMMQVLRGCAKALLSAQRGGSLGRHRRGWVVMCLYSTAQPTVGFLSFILLDQ